MNRTTWKRSFRKKGKLQRKTMRKHNCGLSVGTSPASYNTSNPKTRAESKDLEEI